MQSRFTKLATGMVVSASVLATAVVPGAGRAQADAPMTISWYIPSQQTVPLENTPVIKALQKKFNVVFKITQPQPGTVYDQKKQLVIASHSIPDIMSWITESQANQFGPQGAFLKLNQYLDSELPNVAKLIKSDPADKYNAYTANGDLYVIPDYTEDTAPIVGMSILKSAFAGVGDAAPKTMADYMTALAALKAKYPLSSPLCVRNKDLGPGSGMLRSVFEWAFTKGIAGTGAGTVPDDAPGWNPSTKQFVFQPSAPGFQQAISYVATLYTKHLLDPEFLTTDLNRLRAELKAGQCFSVIDYAAGLSGDAATQKFVNNGLEAIAAPAAAPGSPSYWGMQGSPIGTWDTVLSATLSGDKLQRVLQIMNYVYSDEFQNLLYHNPAVYQHGAYTAALTSGTSRAKVVDTYMPWSFIQLFRTSFLWQAPAGGSYYKMRVAADAGTITTIKPAPALPFTATQTQQLARLQTAVDNVWNAGIEQFVVGQRPISQLPSLIQQARAAGGDQMISIYNSIYKQYFKS